MNARQFVDAIQLHSIRAASESVVSLLENPPGRSPSAELTSLSEWFRGLGESQKDFVTQVAQMASHHAAFGVLAILDGSRRVEEHEGSHFEVRHVTGDVIEVLSGPSAPLLHELL